MIEFVCGFMFGVFTINSTVPPPAPVKVAVEVTCHHEPATPTEPVKIEKSETIKDYFKRLKEGFYAN